MDDSNKKDLEHLRLLSIFYFVSAGLALAGLAFLALHFAIMQAVFTDPDLFRNTKNGPPPAAVFSFMKAFYVFFGAWFVLSGVLNLLSGLFLRKRVHRVFSMVVAGFDCLHLPLGTVLGVFTFIVLGRESVVALYDANRRP